MADLAHAFGPNREGPKYYPLDSHRDSALVNKYIPSELPKHVFDEIARDGKTRYNGVEYIGNKDRTAADKPNDNLIVSNWLIPRSIERFSAVLYSGSKVLVVTWKFPGRWFQYGKSFYLETESKIEDDDFKEYADLYLPKK